MHSALRDVLDRYRFRRLRRTAVQRSVLSGDWRPAFAVTDIPVGAWSVPQGNSSSESAGQNWVRPLLRQADEIAEGRLSFFDLESCDLGRPIGWNHDHSRNRSIPLRFAAAVDYRDYDAVGDAKLAWEPNRHHQFVVLGRAYRATGDERYAVAVCAQLTSWLEQCPFGLGMHWRSPLELAVRLINWVWALDLIRPSGCLDATLRARLLRSVSLHLWEITRKYSRGSSANNHRIGEAAGVFIAARYFQGLKDAERWTAEAREILCLPQMKLGWIAASGPGELVEPTLASLELIADTYLSLNAPIQLAAPVLLEQRNTIQPLLLDRLRSNLEELDRGLAKQKACQRLDVEGGWCAVLRVPVTQSDEELAIDVLRKVAVLVHPGHFYDFPSDGYLVVSLITPPAQFRQGIERVLELMNGS